MKNNRDTHISGLAAMVGKGKIEINGEEAEVDYGDQYEQSLPKDITMETVKLVNNHNKQYIDTMVCAAAKNSESILKKNKKVNKVVNKFDFEVNGSVNVQVDRSKSFRNPSTGEETKSPAIRTIVKSSGVTGSKAYHKRLKVQLAEAISS